MPIVEFHHYITTFTRSILRVPNGRAMRLCLVILAFVACTALEPDAGAQVSKARLAVLVSANIRPYAEAVEGLRGRFSEARGVKMDVLFLDKSKGPDRDRLARRLPEQAYDLSISIGPDATRFLWREVKSGDLPRLYSMVLNPEKVVGEGVASCGIPLNIGVGTQLKYIAQGLPEAGRIGLLYDPLHNEGFFSKALNQGLELGRQVVPLAVSSKKDIPSVLKAHWSTIDAVWLIPDRTVISESIVQYVIKEALLKNTPAIGYNRFFYRRGAALAFVFDYRDLGVQCAEEALALLEGTPCPAAGPVFQVWVNSRVVSRLGLLTPAEYLRPMKLGP